MKKAVSFFLLIVFMLSFITAQGASDRMVSTKDFTYKTFEKVTKRAKITFDINANTVSDGIVGIASATVTPQNYSDYAICFRIREGGYFDSNNGSDFGKANTVNYVKNTTYKVEIDADITNKVYNAYVYINNEKKTVAENYAFRASAGDLGKITARNGGSYGAGLYYIENITVTESEGEFETFTLPNVFCENMVLQRNKPHVIYGRGSGSITATLSKGDLKSSATVEAKDGEFVAELPPLPASLEAYTLTVSSNDKTQVIENVFIGDVFLLAGQSNMAQTYEHQIGEQLGGGVTTSNMPQLITDDRIKFFKLSQTAADSETFDVPFETNGWQPLNDNTKKKMSYIGMFFAKERLNDEPNVPIGLMSVAWRGTTINRWMRKSEENKTLNFTPTSANIYNNHIAPITKYPISAIMWYQGESDSKKPVMYAEAFKTLITDYRKQWNDTDLPFFFVQLARYSKDNYAPLRDAQAKALELDNTGMAVTLDTDKGTYDNIHPLGKEIIAQRLYLLAKKYVYGENVVTSGPLFEKAEVEEDVIKVSFKEDTIGDGLCINNPYNTAATKLCEFEIASENGYFVPAEAKINADNTITVWANGVDEPKYVRYAYSKVPQNPNLFNKNGLPAAPFTTDVRYYSTDSFSSVGYEVENADIQVAQFNICPVKSPINGVVGITDKNNEITAWNSCGITISMNKDGVFQCIDGGDWIMTDIAYESNKLYTIKVVANFTNKTYTAFINDIVACENAAFRSGALEMKNLGRVMFRGGYNEAANEFFGANYRARAVKAGIITNGINDGKLSFSVEIFRDTQADVYVARYINNELIKAEKVLSGITESTAYTKDVAEGERIKLIVTERGSLKPLCEAEEVM